jgi:hypothetical protein
MTADEVQYALTYSQNSPFYIRSHIVVPNVHWGLGFNHELDLLSISNPAHIGTEIEIKVSRGDVKRDLKKEHRHYDDRIRQLYFAGPLTLLDDFINFVPEDFGIITVTRLNTNSLRYICSIKRRAKPLKQWRGAFTKAEVFELMRLGNMRYWSMFHKQFKEKPVKRKFRVDKETNDLIPIGLAKNNPRLNRIWRAMKTRCSNANCENYKWYGGKGINVCDEWLTFYPFYLWAISNGYKENLTIDRIDSNKDYCPENCRWVTEIEQKRNQSNNRPITFNGQTKLAIEWAEITGISEKTICARIDVLRWSVERALTEPVSDNGHRLDDSVIQKVKELKGKTSCVNASVLSGASETSVLRIWSNE